MSATQAIHQTMPRGVFARLAFLAVASADRDGGLYDHPVDPFLSEEDALALGTEMDRAFASAESLGASNADYLAVRRYLSGAP